MRTLSLALAAALLSACATQTEAPAPVAEAEASAPVEAKADSTVIELPASAKLSVILAAQDDDVKARYQYRNPQETIEFFDIKPGMTVAEILPGGGWYSKILMPYLGSDGALVGIDYSVDMWSKFGGFATEEFLEAKKTWPETWTNDAAEWRSGTDVGVDAFAFGSRDTALDGTVDAVLAVRAMHHLNRFNTEEQDYMAEALGDIFAILKPGGTFGIVQHRAPEGNDDAWAGGDNGYVKQSAVIAWAEAAGFELVASSEINANPLDKPGNDDFVWRLPPTLGTSGDDPELRAKMVAIGETDRMTLKFRKPTN